MYASRWLLLLILLPPIGGCSTYVPPDDDDSAEDSCVALWQIPPDAGVVIVDPTAEPGGGGTPDAPFATLADGLAGARAGDQTFVAMTAGTFTGAPFELTAADEDLTLVGCGEETVIASAGSLGIDVVEASGIALRGFVVDGARVGIRVRMGAGADAPVRIADVTVSDAVRTGIEIMGADTRVELTDVIIDGVTEADSMGYGLLSWGSSEIRSTGGAIRNATRVGVCISGATFELTGLVVEGTLPAGGTLGRGIQLQAGASGTLDGVSITGSSDAGIFLRRTGAVTITGTTVAQTAVVDVQGEPGAQSGAGLVITSDILEDPGVPIETIEVTLSTNTFSANERLGVLVEGFGIEATLDGNVLSDNILPDETTFPVDAPFFQLGATVDVVAGEVPIELTDDAVQTVFREELPVEDE